MSKGIGELGGGGGTHGLGLGSCCRGLGWGQHGLDVHQVGERGALLVVEAYRVAAGVESCGALVHGKLAELAEGAAYGSTLIGRE